MPNKNLNKWFEAAKLLGENPNKKVLCPTCKVGYLYIKDVIVEKENKCVRHLLCSNCKEYVAMTFFID
jgi:uncharacterized protein YlaI